MTKDQADCSEASAALPPENTAPDLGVAWGRSD